MTLRLISNNLMSKTNNLKSIISCWLHERFKAQIIVSFPLLAKCFRLSWLDLHNRNEKLLIGSDKHSRICTWQESSWLSVAKIFPSFGKAILEECIQLTPIVLNKQNNYTNDQTTELSVILPVGGEDRVEQFITTVKSFLSQTIPTEIIVVEEAEEPIYKNLCPKGTTYIYIPRLPGKQFNKSKALNAGAKAAKSNILLLQDSDVLVPTCFAAQIKQRFDLGWEILKPMRFIFHLSQEESMKVQQTEQINLDTLSDIQQNNPGISTALTKSVYCEVGGHDESFEGWGGEDLEFLDRLEGRKFFKGSFLWGIHLWHPPAPKKLGEGNVAQLKEKLEISRQKRIQKLRACNEKN